jgi:hypothetical protein
VQFRPHAQPRSAHPVRASPHPSDGPHPTVYNHCAIGFGPNVTTSHCQIHSQLSLWFRAAQGVAAARFQCNTDDRHAATRRFETVLESPIPCHQSRHPIALPPSSLIQFMLPSKFLLLVVEPDCAAILIIDPVCTVPDSSTDDRAPPPTHGSPPPVQPDPHRSTPYPFDCDLCYPWIDSPLSGASPTLIPLHPH